MIGRQQALFVGVIGALNPWGILFGRTAYEATLSSFFFVLGIYLLIVLKRGWISVAAISFTLAFFTYIGTKLIFLPIVFVSSIYSWNLNKNNYFKFYAAFFVFLTSIFILYILTFRLSSSGYRTYEVTPNFSEISSRVERNAHLAVVNPINKVFSNKAAILLWDFTDRYLGAFSLQRLFLTGEGNEHFSLWYHGYFYVLDLFLIPMGAIYLLKVNKRLLTFLTLILILSPVPSAIYQGTPSSYVFRSSLMFPVLIVFIGLGAFSFYKFLKGKKQVIVYVGFSLIYFFLVSNFAYIYFLRAPLYNSEFGDFSARELTQYISLATAENNEVRVVTSEPEIVFGQYIFYKNLITKSNVEKIKSGFLKNSFEVGQVSFNKCPNDELGGGGIIVVKNGLNCKIDGQTKTKIAKISDSGTLYYIYNDTVCNEYPAQTFASRIKMSDLQVENLSKEEFCTKYILRDL